MGTWGSKGDLRCWPVSGLVLVAGDFTIASSAIASIHPTLGGFTLKRFAAGVYGVMLAQAGWQAVIAAEAGIGPDTGITGALPTANPAATMISKGFLTSNAGGTAFAADTTNSKLLILVTNGGALVDVPANYRLTFAITLAENQLSK